MERWNMRASSLTSRLRRCIGGTRVALVAASPDDAPLRCGDSGWRIRGHRRRGRRYRLADRGRLREVSPARMLRRYLGRLHAADRVHGARCYPETSATYGCFRGDLAAARLCGRSSRFLIFAILQLCVSSRSAASDGVHRGRFAELRRCVGGVPLVPAFFRRGYGGERTSRFHLGAGRRGVLYPWRQVQHFMIVGAVKLSDPKSASGKWSGIAKRFRGSLSRSTSAY